jgi:hypothetical protein
MNDDKQADGAAVLSSAWLGVTGPKRTDALQQMIADADRAAFETWAVGTGKAYRDKNGLWFYRNGGDGLFDAWQGRGALMPTCRGVAHRGCEYLAACGHVCNKCGRVA